MPKLPPGPTSRLLATIDIFRRPLEMLARMGARHGDPFFCPTFQGPLIVTGQPEGARAVFGADPNTFASAVGEELQPFLGRFSVLTQNGAEHREARRLLMPPFHGERMRLYGQLMADVARRRAVDWPAARPLVLRTCARGISLDVIIEAVMGISDEAMRTTMRAALIDLIEHTNPLLFLFKWMRVKLGGLGPWARFLRRKERVNAILRAEIRSRRERGAADRVDVLTLLCDARHEDGSTLADEEIIDQLTTF